MKQWLKAILCATLILGMTGCINKEEETTEEDPGHFYDPQVPFGQIYDRFNNIADVTNLEANVAILQKVKLTWRTPSLYTTLDYQIVIYKRASPPEGFNIVCPDPVGAQTAMCPQEEASAATIYKVKEVKANTWTDENGVDAETQEEIINVEDDTDYSYWVFVKVGDKFSKGVRINTHTRAPESVFQMPPIAKFWEKLKWNYGQNPTVYCAAQTTLAGCQGMPMGYSCSWNASATKCERVDVCSSETTQAACTVQDKINHGCTWNNLSNRCQPPAEKYQSLYSLDHGTSLPGDPKGGVAFAANGNIMFVSDTDNNRVMIYQRQGAMTCTTYTDPYEQAACMLQYSGAPLLAYNVLGQAKVDRAVPCGDPLALPSNSCMVKPTKVVVDGNRLLVSDSGNNRILIYNSLPIDGCDPEVVVGTIKPTNCTPARVIGKAGLNDLTTYTVEASGDASLRTPTDMIVKEDALYIADTGNNRIVKVSNYADPSYFSCTSQTWGGGLCKFSAVLGQMDMFSRKYFEQMVADDPTIIQSAGLQDLLSNGNQNLLKRYFREPIRIVFDADGRLFVGANERFSKSNPIGGRNAIRGRILIFNGDPLAGTNPVCNAATFNDGSGSCDAVDVMGQARFDKLENVSGSNPQDYNQIAYGMYQLDDFDIKEIPPDETLNETETKRLLLAVDGSSNGINVWNDIKIKISDGYPKSGVIVDPQGAYDPNRAQNMPDLKNLCTIRVNSDMDLIYAADCGGYRVYEVQAYKIPGVDF